MLTSVSPLCIYAGKSDGHTSSEPCEAPAASYSDSRQSILESRCTSAVTGIITEGSTEYRKGAPVCVTRPQYILVIIARVDSPWQVSVGLIESWKAVVASYSGHIRSYRRARW